MKQRLVHFLSLCFVISGFFLFTQPVHATVTSSLVGYWKLDEETVGATSTDSSGFGNTLTTVGSPSTTTTVPSDIDFTDSYAVMFGDTTGTLSIANPTGFATGTAPRTLSVWINPTSFDTLMAPVAYGSCSYGGAMDGAGKAFGFYINTDAHLHFWGCDSADFDTGATVEAGTWSNVILLYNGTTVKVYLNGSLVGSQDEVLVTNANAFQIGGVDLIDEIGYYFYGGIDDVRVYSRALSTTEIAALASGSHTSATWTGASSTTDYFTAGNWDTGAVPDPYTKITITSSTYEPKLTATGTFAGLTINASSTFDNGGFNTVMNDSGTFTNYGTFILHGNEYQYGMSNDTAHGAVMYVSSGADARTTFGYSYNDVIFNDSLVGYWQFDESTTGYAADTSGYRRNGTAYGSGGTNNLPQPSTSTPTTNFYDTGSMNFDGTDDYFDVARGVPAEIQGSTDKMITMWVYPTQAQEGFLYMGPDDGGTSGQSLRLQTDTSGYLKLDVSSGSQTSSLQLLQNTWQFIAVFWDGSNWQVCLNGSCDILSSLPDSDLQPGIFNIGRGVWDSVYMKGKIDDVRVYSRVLSDDSFVAMTNGDEPSTSLSTTTIYSSYFAPRNLYLNSGTLEGRYSHYVMGGNIINNGGIHNPGSGGISLSHATLINSSMNLGSVSISSDVTTTIIFAAGSTLTASSLTMGNYDSTLYFRSSVSGRQYNFYPTYSVTLYNIDLQDANNSTGSIISLADDTVTNSGNNSNWFYNLSSIDDFTATASSTTAILTWTNPTDAEFANNMIRYRTDQAPVATYEGTLAVDDFTGTTTSTTGLSEGTYYFSIFSTDIYGGEVVMASTSVIIDVTDPTVPGTPTSTSPTSSSQPLISWDASSDSGAGLAGVPYFLQWSSSTDFITSDAETAVTPSATPYVALADGTWYFRVLAIDANRNSSDYSATGTIIIDTTAPTITITGSAATQVTQNATYTDAGATATDSISGSLTDSIVVANHVNTSVPGTYTVVYTVSDGVGNTATATRTVQVVPGYTGGGGSSVAPLALPLASGQAGTFTVVVNESTSGTVKTNTSTIKLSFNGGASVRGMALSLTPDFYGAGIQPYSSETTYTLPKPGDYTLYVRFYSATGNWTTPIARSISYTTGIAPQGSVGVNAATAPQKPVSGQFKRNLGRGSVGADVRALQQFLNKNGFTVATKGPGSPGHETTLYGRATAAAVSRFQEANATIVLKPLGLKKGTGNFFTATRATANSLSGQ